MAEFRKLIIPGRPDGNTFSFGNFQKVYIDIPQEMYDITIGYGNIYGSNYGGEPV